MNDPHVAMIERPYGLSNESSVSAVSWGAVIAGAFVAAALSLSLVALGSGLGLLAMSPWENAGASGKTIGIGSAIWLALMEIISAGIGGYIAGRLRTKWVDARTDEIFFRDTAHGFLVWAVGLVISAAFLTSAASSLVGGTAKVAAAALGPVAGAATAEAAQPAGSISQTGASGPVSMVNPSGYYVDRLLRTEKPAAEPAPGTQASNAPAQPDVNARGNDATVRAELGRVMATGLRNGQLNPQDRTYVAQVVASRTGLSQADAEKRVDDVLEQERAASNEARATADQARKAGAYFSLWLFVSLLIGAFCASYFATVGGRLRDRVTV